MFKDPRLRRPWFKTLNGGDGQGIGTQDFMPGMIFVSTVIAVPCMVVSE
jgi:hypothetical protein